MFDFTTHPRFASKQETEKGIARAIKASTSQRVLLHLCLVGALDHATGAGNGDTTLLSKLYNGLGNETNKAKGIYLWIRKFTNLKYSKAKDGTEQWLKPKKEALIVTAGYEATPFYEMPEVDKANKPFDFHAALSALLERAEKKVKELPPEQVEELTAIAAFFKRKSKFNKKAYASTEVLFEAALPA